MSQSLSGNVDSGIDATLFDRRKLTRYRFSAPITVYNAEGIAMRGMSIEISETGMSILVGASLKVGDQVKLEPVADSKASAQVRHQTGKVYGFQFIDLTPEQVQRIRKSCQRFPRFSTAKLEI